MPATEIRSLTSRFLILGLLLVAVLAVATPAHAQLADATGSQICWNPCTLLQIIFPDLMCIQVCW